MKGKLCKVKLALLVMWGYPDCSSQYDELLQKNDLLVILGGSGDLRRQTTLAVGRWVVYSQRFRKKGTVYKGDVEVLDDEG